MKRFGLEMVMHQLDSKFGEDLENEIRYIRQNDILKLKNTKLPEIVKEHTGLKVNFDSFEGDGAFVMMPDFNRNHVLHDDLRINHFTEEDSKKFFSEKGFIEGIVNLQTGRVYGDFTKVSSDLYLGSTLLNGKSNYTVREAVAILLHEIGHIFTYLELVGRVVRTNWIMEETLLKLKDAKTIEQRTVILKDVEKATKTTIAKRDEIASNARTDEAYSVIVLSKCAEQYKRELDIDIYDSRQWEQLADQYSARYGYAKDLATGLDKLYRDYGHMQYDSTIMHMFCQSLNIGLWGIIATVTVAGGPLVVTLIVTLGLMALGNPVASEYDPPKERFIKLKQSLIDGLKNPKLTKVQKIKYLEDYEVVVNTLEKLNENNNSWIYAVYTFTPWGRRDKAQVKRFQEIEGLNNNDLFAVHSLLGLESTGSRLDHYEPVDLNHIRITGVEALNTGKGFSDDYINKMLQKYHISTSLITKEVYHLSKDKNLKTLTPLVPKDTGGKGESLENTEIPRACFSDSIDGCLLALGIKDKDFKDNKSMTWYMYTPTDKFKGVTNDEVNKSKQVFDSKVTKELWAVEKTPVSHIGEVEVFFDVIDEIKYKPLVPDGKKIDLTKFHDDGFLRSYLRKHKVSRHN